LTKAEVLTAYLPEYLADPNEAAKRNSRDASKRRG